MTDPTDFTALLIEDNPGDARLIREMLRDAEELPRRVDPETSAGQVPQLHHESRLSDGLSYFEDHHVDVVLLDLNLPDSSGLETVSATVEAAPETPIVVLTGFDDRQAGVEAIEQGAQDYLVKDEVTSSSLVRSLHYAIERKSKEIERKRHREELESLHRLNRISQDVTHIVINATSRDSLEQRVCERLVDAEDYLFAWIGRLEQGGNRVVPETSAGIEDGYLDETEITVGDTETAEGPTATAVETERLQAVQDIANDPDFESWREMAMERGYRSSIAVPIVHDDLRYGVLNVYASSPEAFSEPQKETFARLGDIVGHAISAIERKNALVSDAVLELEFRLNGVATPLVDRSGDGDCTVRIDRFIRTDDEAHLLYGNVSGLPAEEFQEAADEIGVIDRGRIVEEGPEERAFEAITTEPVSLIETVVTHSGRVQSATIDDGEFRLVVELPRGRGTRKLVTEVEETCPSAEFVAQRTAEREEGHFLGQQSPIESRLTEKQQTALETAFRAGYFEWPRTSTGEEISERLGIAPATFGQHLRTAERKVFEALFES